tara:strand:- start:780 stop:1196 length:417 start_codon:yes stop_codon:yes gene_type:complete
MKRFLAIFTLVVATSVVVADIHEPPKSRYTSNRKFARGVSNILYGWTEIPMTMTRMGELHTEQSVGIFVGGFTKGVQRWGARLKYGVYEVVNFHRPLYKDSYRPAMASINYLPTSGYEEFPPQIGFISTNGYVRGRSW